MAESGSSGSWSVVALAVAVVVVVGIAASAAAAAAILPKSRCPARELIRSRPNGRMLLLAAGEAAEADAVDVEDDVDEAVLPVPAAPLLPVKDQYGGTLDGSPASALITTDGSRRGSLLPGIAN